MSVGVRHLYLVRHARAEERGPEWPDDALRPLTAEGARRFSVAARGLARLEGMPQVVVTSPLTRAEQTADLLAEAARPTPRVVKEPALAAGATPEAMMKVIAAVRRATRIAVVGHEPDLGVLVAHLIGSRTAVPFKKGAMCRIDLTGQTATLVWLLPPVALRALARS